MLNDINLNVFHLITSIPIISGTALKFTFFLAYQLIFIFFFIVILYWFFYLKKNIIIRIIFVYKTFVAVIISLLISWIIGKFFYQERPFVMITCKHFFIHKETPSFPSNHGIVTFTISFSFLFWFKKYWIGLLLFIKSFIIAIARIFFCIHWPLDMLGSFILSLIACWISQLLYKVSRDKISSYLIKFYQFFINLIFFKSY
ncbi:MAG: phosphatase PAP2 family protein [Arsenophonus sp.]|nr:MAG: phosphatase PAP2 family protein [Arsenophonus sp.]